MSLAQRTPSVRQPTEKFRKLRFSCSVKVPNIRNNLVLLYAVKCLSYFSRRIESRVFQYLRSPHQESCKSNYQCSCLKIFAQVFQFSLTFWAITSWSWQVKIVAWVVNLWGIWNCKLVWLSEWSHFLRFNLQFKNNHPIAYSKFLFFVIWQAIEVTGSQLLHQWSAFKPVMRVSTDQYSNGKMFDTWKHLKAP